MDVSRIFARNARSTSAVAAPETKSAKERIEAALRRVPILEDSPDAVTRIMKQGRFGRIDSEKTFIHTGEHDEDVYFLVAGRVRISWKGGILHEWNAPEVVGELAASMHRPRSADATALEGGIAFMKINGSEFRSILHDFPEVRKRLEIRKDEMLQARIPRSGRTQAMAIWPRTLIALLAGAAAGFVAYITINYIGASETIQYTFALCSAAIVSLFVMIWSPAFMLRSVAVSAGLSAIGIATVGVPYIRVKLNGIIFPGTEGIFSLGQSFTGGKSVAAMIVLAIIAVIFLWASFKL